MNKKHTLYVIGIGPGAYEQLTLQAINALNACNTIIGYPVYTDLIKPYFPDKTYMTTPMKKEVDRCIMALTRASVEEFTAIICSGDSGVYGMAGLILELSKDFKDVSIKIIPGITAALSGGSILGAPLSHDFVVISLSDLLTPITLIEQRLIAAAKGDFAICIYNPSSKKRSTYLSHACDILLNYLSPDTKCGIAKNIGREGEETTVLTLKELRDTKTDMFSTVFIGNSTTIQIDNYIVTPRGYHYE